MYCFFAPDAFFGRFALMGCRCWDRVSGGEDQAIAFAYEMEGTAGIVGDDQCQAFGIGFETGDVQGAGVGRHPRHTQG